MKKIACVGWRLTRDEAEVLNNTSNYIQKSIGLKIDIITTDVFRETIRNCDYYIAFGKSAFKEIEAKHVFLLPAIKELKKDRKKSLVKLLEVIKEIREIENEKAVEIHVEREDRITIGKEACDINITAAEAEYLKTLKALLGGSKMVIMKGDIRIEVE